jgi:sphinganine-1-phosphate aldolase
VTVVHVPLNPDLTPNMAAYEKAITANTILLLCSAPEYCYGMVDPVPTISRLAVRHNLPLHVDACFGGFMLPWVEKLGYSLPEFDFRLPGVTSMSADIHKYGLGIKASTSGLIPIPPCHVSVPFRRGRVWYCIGTRL